MARIRARGPNHGFIMWSPSHRRGRILEAGRILMGSAFSNPNFTRRFMHEGDLGQFMSERIDVTVSKVMFALAESFVEGDTRPNLVVEGAQLQHGTGNSRPRRRGDRTFLRGTEAAHLGIGTFTRHGEAVSRRGLLLLEDLADRRGVAREDIPRIFGAGGELVGLGLVHDAKTFLAPAFYNRAEGLLEAAKQQLLQAIAQAGVPRSIEDLERVMIGTAERAADALAHNRRFVIQPLMDRILAITHGQASEFAQDQDDADNLMFRGSERELDEAILATLQGSSNAFHDSLRRIMNDIPVEAAEMAERVEGTMREMSTAGTGGESSGSDAGASGTAGGGSP